ncbi:MAG: shikimate kinase, partial [Phycisphaeraceae bacterium]
LGYRGSGKTSIGKQLAVELWKDFVDLDDATRQRFNNQTIADIWAEHGEAVFRQAEAESAGHLLAKENQVIALGGGTLTTDAGKAAVTSAENATRIYLSCSADVLAKRIASDATTATERPSLTGNSDPAAEVEEVLAQRDPVYREVADIVFDVTYCSIAEAVRHLIAKL